MYLTTRQRLDIAAEIISACDTVTILTGDEVRDIYKRAEIGDFDDVFDYEEQANIYARRMSGRK